MSLLDVFPCAYPRVSPVSQGRIASSQGGSEPRFKVGACIHNNTDPVQLAMHLKNNGFDHVTGGGRDDAESRLVQIAACEAGLTLLAGAAHYTGEPPVVGDILLTLNEPNSARFWRHDVPEDQVSERAQPLIPTFAKLREVAGSRPIIGGNLTWIDRCHPEEWVRAFWSYGANSYWDYIGVHAYDGGGRATVRQAEEVMQTYRRAGFRQPFWITEFGFRVDKGMGSPEKQARWLTYALSKFSRNLAVRGAVVYEFYNATGFALIDAKTNRPRPALKRIREAMGVPA